jgi:hypothetical protein
MDERGLLERLLERVVKPLPWQWIVGRDGASTYLRADRTGEAAAPSVQHG